MSLLKNIAHLLYIFKTIIKYIYLIYNNCF